MIVVPFLQRLMMTSSVHKRSHIRIRFENRNSKFHVKCRDQNLGLLLFSVVEFYFSTTLFTTLFKDKRKFVRSVVRCPFWLSLPYSYAFGPGQTTNLEISADKACIIPRDISSLRSASSYCRAAWPFVSPYLWGSICLVQCSAMIYGPLSSC